MRIALSDAYELIERCFIAVGHSAPEAKIIAGQVVDIELRGAHFGGFSRALSMCRLISGPSGKRQPISVVRETSVSVLLDGGNNVGYIVAHRATQIAVDKAKSQGLALAGARNTFFTGQYSYYMEMATREGLVAMAMGSSAAFAAPYGATQGRFGTNPIAFGFPTETDPVIVDIGTSSVSVGDLILWSRTGKKLEQNIAYDESGDATDDPSEALKGAIAVWGGHKGSGIALAVQLSGILMGANASPPDHRDAGYFIMVIDPDLFGDRHEFEQRVRAYVDTLATARPRDPQNPPRIPFARSASERRERLASGFIDVPDAIVAQLRDISAGTASNSPLQMPQDGAGPATHIAASV